MKVKNAGRVGIGVEYKRENCTILQQSQVEAIKEHDPIPHRFTPSSAIILCTLTILSCFSVDSDRCLSWGIVGRKGIIKGERKGKNKEDGKEKQ
jgi:hypothetical protein